MEIGAIQLRLPGGYSVKHIASLRLDALHRACLAGERTLEVPVERH
jgi:hypothetical protein